LNSPGQSAVRNLLEQSGLQGWVVGTPWQYPAVVGAAIYRYPTVAAARGALRLDVVQDPTPGTVDFIAAPYFVAIGNTLVSFAASDANAAVRIIAILQQPRP